MCGCRLNLESIPANSPNVRWMWFEALNRPVAANIVKHTRGIFMSWHQQPSRWIHTNSCHRRTLSWVRACCWRHHIYTTTRSQVPESHRLILRTRHKHCTAPIVKRQNVTAVTAKSLIRRRSGTICDVDFAVAGAATDQETRLVGTVFEEAKIANCSVVHCEFDLVDNGEKNK